MQERIVQQEQQATKGGKANAGDNSLNDLDLPAAAAPDSNKSLRSRSCKLRIFESARAAKAVGLLQSNCTSLGRLCVRAEKCQEHVPPAVPFFFFPPFPKAMRGIPPGRCKLHGPGSTWKASQKLQRN